jgi:hypothetical protein
MSLTENPFGQGALVSIIGGTTSEISGGKFANGAVTAAMAYAFNSLSQDFLRRNATQVETLRSESGESFSDFADRVNDRIMFHTEETRFEHSAAFASRELTVDGEVQVQYGAIIETQGSHLFSASTKIPKGFSPVLNSQGNPLTIHSHGISAGQKVNDLDLRFRPELMTGTNIKPVVPPQDRFRFSEFDGPGALATPDGIKWWPGESP